MTKIEKIYEDERYCCALLPAVVASQRQKQLHLYSVKICLWPSVAERRKSKYTKKLDIEGQFETPLKQSFRAYGEITNNVELNILICTISCNLC